MKIERIDLRACDCGKTPEVLHGWLNSDYVACECGRQTDEYEMHAGKAERAWNNRDLLPFPQTLEGDLHK